MADEQPRTRRAAFDIRLIIALLIGVYGLVLTVMGAAFMPGWQIAKAAGINSNLWAGVGMLVFATLFLAWTVLRPIRVPEQPRSGE
jgi:hypothetical protein